MYAGALGDNAVERYALFLTSLALSADPVERRAALQRAREHGLDVPRVAIVTAERTIERALDSLPSSVKGQLPNLAKVAQEPTEEAEMLLVRSIEWTVVEGETYDTALEQANVILRYLLGARISLHLSLHVANAQSCWEQRVGGSTWRACSWICFPLNWRRSAHLRSARQSI
jgi:nuclear pore complex protein Nup107